MLHEHMVLSSAHVKSQVQQLSVCNPNAGVVDPQNSAALLNRKLQVHLKHPV